MEKKPRLKGCVKLKNDINDLMESKTGIWTKTRIPGYKKLSPRTESAMWYPPQKFNFHLSLRAAVTALAIVFALIFAATQTAQGQTFKVLHDFSGPDGDAPTGGLIMDNAGNLYGVAAFGGDDGFGTVFLLSNRGNGWVLNRLYSFTGGSDGSEPLAPLIFGPDGALYGTGSGDAECAGGTVFSLRPPPTAPPVPLAGWSKTLLYSFPGGCAHGQNTGTGPLVFDQHGNLYGTTTNSSDVCVPSCGSVYELTPSNGGWTLTVLFSFTGGSDGGQPFGGLIFDNAGNLYGAASQGGLPVGLFGGGVVYELTPSGSGWTEKILYNFSGGSDGVSPLGGLIFGVPAHAPARNLYGTTAQGGSGGGGTVFELSPSGGSWTYSLLHSFTGTEGPTTSLTMYGGGSLYGTTYADGAYLLGSVFKLKPSGSGGWTFTSLHDFTGGSDGELASGDVIFDSAGNLYSVTWGGNVFEITP
jgi:uncharacterized repeat protein (TIGR03803 family)